MTKSLREFSQELKRLPKVVAFEIATAAAPEITTLANRSFDEGVSPYGVAWKKGIDGKPVTLRKTGALEKYVRYVATGMRIRVSLGVKYAKYQIGKRPVYPSQDRGLPDDYLEVLQRTAARIIKAHFA